MRCQIDQNTNKFWELIGAVIDVDLRVLPYAARLDRLRAHGVGLWDVIAEAERPGSLDAAIRRATPNALAELLSTLPALQAVAFNGGTAARQGRRLVSAIPHITVLDLPSSSPAHTIPLEKKKAAWSALGAFLSA